MDRYKHTLLGIALIACGYAQAYDRVDVVTATDKILFFDKSVNLKVETFLTKEPAPTVILAHACGGDTATGQTAWAERIRSWGYNVVKPDSFTPRGVDRDCGPTRLVQFSQRANDFAAVAKWASQQPWHTGSFVVVGFSHGAVGGLNFATDPNTDLIKGIVAYYPSCRWAGISSPKIPVVMHIGLADDWAGYRDCIRIADGNNMFSAHTYEGASHVFDRHLPFSHYNGFKVGYDPVAAPAAERTTRKFIDQQLKGIK